MAKRRKATTREARQEPIDCIDVPPGRRPVSQAAVDRLAESMAKIGLRTPITVRSAEDTWFRADLVTGAHRLAAARQLGWETILCFTDDLDEREAELWEIDENLCRHSLSPAEVAAATARRKVLYEQEHPETKNGAAGNGRTKKKLGKICQATQKPADRFTQATAQATGLGERTIRLAATRGEKIGVETLHQIAGTSLDAGVELDALVKLPPVEQQALIVRAVAGEKVSARPVKVKALAISEPVKVSPVDLKKEALKDFKVWCSKYSSLDSMQRLVRELSIIEQRLLED